MSHCEAHNQTPTSDPADVCNGDLFVCSCCGKSVCAGYGGCDDECDLCFATGKSLGNIVDIPTLIP